MEWALWRCVGSKTTTRATRTLQPHWNRSMPSSFDSVTPSFFQRRLPEGKCDLIFKVAFGSNSAGARDLAVSRMTVWRWRNGQATIPKSVLDKLGDRLQTKVEEAHAAQNKLRDILALPPKPPRPLSGCCAGRHRKIKKLPVTKEEWAALGY